MFGAGVRVPQGPAESARRVALSRRAARRTARRRRSRPRSRPRRAAGRACTALAEQRRERRRRRSARATSFSRSNAKRIASTSCASVTVTISSTSRLLTSNVSSPGIVACRPSAIVRGTSIVDALAGGQRAARVVARLRLDADDARTAAAAPARRSRSRRSARRRRPATTSTSRSGDVGEQLERDRALAGHHARVVVGRDERQPALVGERAAERLAILRVAVVRARPRRRSRASRRPSPAARPRA